MDIERFKERILETENLTDELEDADANWLLDWGIARLDQVLKSIEDPETAGSRVNALMAVMRKINRIAGSYADKSPRRLAEDLAELHGLFTEAFGPAGSTSANGEQSPPQSTEPSDESESSPSPIESQPIDLWRHLQKPASSSSQPPESNEPAQSTPDFTAAAGNLVQLSPTDSLHYLAQDFFPLP